MDDNDKPILYGVSHLDGITPVAVLFDSSRRMMTDSITPIQFSPSLNAIVDPRGYPVAKATDDVTNKVLLPWVVNAGTGAVLINTA